MTGYELYQNTSYGYEPLSKLSVDQEVVFHRAVNFVDGVAKKHGYTNCTAYAAKEPWMVLLDYWDVNGVSFADRLSSADNFVLQSLKYTYPKCESSK